jgi:hypothetical protein
MRAIDIALRILGTLTAIGAFFLPGKVESALFCFSFFSIGIWGVIYPPGIMGWAKVSHPDLDPADESIWWVPRLVGTGLVLMSIIFVYMSLSKDFVSSP